MEPRVELDDPFVSLPTQGILQFYDYTQGLFFLQTICSVCYLMSIREVIRDIETREEVSCGFVFLKTLSTNKIK